MKLLKSHSYYMKKSPHRDPVLVSHILEAIEKIEKYTDNINFESFVLDTMRIDAVVREITIIGEAATRIPPEIRLLAPAIPWKSIVGFRNIVIHDYANVSMGKAWDVTQNDLPKLKEALVSLRGALDRQYEKTT